MTVADLDEVARIAERQPFPPSQKRASDEAFLCAAEASDDERAVVNSPRRVVDALEGHRLARERIREVQPLAAPVDAALAVDDSGLEVRLVLDDRFALGERSR